MGTWISGFFRASPSPLAVADPIRRPVKEPGPPDTAMASMEPSSVSVMVTISSIMGRSVWEWVFLKFTVYSAVRMSSVTMAADATSEELSIPSILIVPFPPL